MVDPARSVADLVLAHSECAAVFQRFAIDFCCGGQQSISEACERAGVDTATLIEELSRAIAERNGAVSFDPRRLPAAELIDYIVGKHHRYLRRALPFVQTLAAKVSRVHGARNPKLRELERLVYALAADLLPHIEREEQVLFPLIVAESPDGPRLERELAAVQAEHRTTGMLLHRLRDAANDFQLPPWACNSYRVLFDELEELERDTLRHVHLENHALVARFTS